MKCPHCGYEVHWDEKGDEGDFYILSNGITMRRDATGMGIEDLRLWGCPRCDKIFMK